MIRRWWATLAVLAVLIAGTVGVYAQSMQYIAPFEPFGGSVSLAVGPASNNIQLGWVALSPQPNPPPLAVAVCNIGSTDAFVLLGDDNTLTVTTASGLNVRAGACPELKLNKHKYLAAITTSGNTTVVISTGNGTLGGGAQSGPSSGFAATLTAKTVTVTQTPTVTTGNAYGANYVVGGKLIFTNAFQAAGSGILQSVKLRFKTVQSNGFTLFLFNSDPSTTAWTDAAAAAINAADVTKIAGIVPLNCSQQLGGSSTFCFADGIAQAHSPGGTTLWGVLLANQALSANFGSTSDVQVSLTILDD